MKSYLLTICLFATICFASGCTTFWHQKEKSFYECENDFKDCRFEMEQRADKGISLGFYNIRFKDRCMKDRGYRLRWEWQLPLQVRRQGPGYYFSSQRHGIAGSID